MFHECGPQLACPPEHSNKLPNSILNLTTLLVIYFTLLGIAVKQYLKSSINIWMIADNYELMSKSNIFPIL